jgi:hypothetical protein
LLALLTIHNTYNRACIQALPSTYRFNRALWVCDTYADYSLVDKHDHG